MDLSDKMLEISIELGGELEKKGKGYKHRYFRTEDIIPKVLIKCKEWGIRFHTQFTHEYAKIKFWDKDNKDDTLTYQLPIIIRGDDGAEKSIQLIGKMQTYYKRYLFIQAFNICEVDELELVEPKPRQVKKQERIPVMKTKRELEELYTKIVTNCKEYDKCVSSQIWAYYDEKIITEEDTHKLLDMYKEDYGEEAI